MARVFACNMRTMLRAAVMEGSARTLFAFARRKYEV